MYNFVHWFQYVDDISACFCQTSGYLYTVLKFIQTICLNVKYTMELKNDSNIDFLAINRLDAENGFPIIHKPAHRDITNSS